MGGLVVSQSIHVGGEKMNDAVVNYLKKNSGMLIGDRTAEAVKIDLASAIPPEGDSRRTHVRGRDLLSARVMDVEFTAAQAHDAVLEPCMAIMASVRWVLERTPPELSADIMRNGIYLTGGAAQLYGLDRLIGGQLGIPAMLAKDPQDCTILGMGYLLENPDLLADLARSGINDNL
jgi:rod shape-determining protein MreB